MQGQEVYGDISGTLQEPKVSVEMSRLLKFQVNKQMNLLLGTQKSEEVKKELKSVKQDVDKKIDKFNDINLEDVKDRAKLFLNNFF